MIQSYFKLLLVVFLLGFGKHTKSQSTILDDFAIFQSNGKVYLNWVISSGSICNGTKIFRSIDSVQYVQIGSIVGDCGSISSSQAYNFIDSEPIKNTKNYYKLELGTTGFSKVLTIEIIDLEKNNYQIRPNPIISTGEILFENTKKEQHFLKLYNMNGMNQFLFSSNSNSFFIDKKYVYTGLYLFLIVNENNMITAQGKLLIR